MEIVVTDWESKIQAYNLPEKLKAKCEAQNEIEIIYLSEIGSYEYDQIIAYYGNTPNEQVLRNFKNLKWIQFGSSGIDKISNEYIEENKLTVSNIGRINSKALVTFILGELFLSCKTGVIDSKNDQTILSNRRIYDRELEKFLEYDELHLLILGYGNTTRNLISLLSNVVKEISIITSEAKKNDKNIKFYTHDNYFEGLRNNPPSHVINLLSLKNETKCFVDSDFINKINNSFYYINCGRAETQEKSDLIHALNSQKIWGASLDVFGLPGGEIDKEFRGISNIRLTPHISGWTKHFWKEMESIILFNSKKYFTKNNLSEMKNLLFKEGKQVRKF